MTVTYGNDSMDVDFAGKWRMVMKKSMDPRRKRRVKRNLPWRHRTEVNVASLYEARHGTTTSVTHEGAHPWHAAVGEKISIISGTAIRFR